MTLFDNETSHSSEATATLTAPEGTTSTNHTEPEAPHAEPAHQAAAAAPALVPSDAPGAAPSAAPSTDNDKTEAAKAEAETPPARPAVELPAHEEAAAEDFATALENYENAASAGEPEESAAGRMSTEGEAVKWLRP